MTRWVDDYMAVPHVRRGRSGTGYDCYGLVRAILTERAGLSLARHDGFDVSRGMDVAALISSEATDWLPIERGDERQFDVVIMRGVFEAGGKMVGADMHMGLVTKPGHLIHTEEKAGVQHQPFTHPAIRDRIRKIYRHRALA